MPETTVQWKDNSEAIGAVLYQFEKAFREGKEPTVEDYLQGEGLAQKKYSETEHFLLYSYQGMKLLKNHPSAIQEPPL